MIGQFPNTAVENFQRRATSEPMSLKEAWVSSDLFASNIDKLRMQACELVWKYR
ncbi:MAG: hypothetical protein QXJ03_03825 [Desulfurococcus sp.]|uniref:hypothetical protein n=1 Tax=Desulfurococcus sp. TaxID=51678 RepID=UPI00316A33AD